MLFFIATDGIHRGPLWKSDGSAAGTIFLHEFSYQPPQFLTNRNGTLFFYAAGATGAGLWKSDGTAAGTQLVSSAPGTPFNLINSNGTLFFFGNNGSGGLSLWKSDGTTAGTVLLRNVGPGRTDMGSVIRLGDGHGATSGPGRGRGRREGVWSGGRRERCAIPAHDSGRKAHGGRRPGASPARQSRDYRCGQSDARSGTARGRPAASCPARPGGDA